MSFCNYVILQIFSFFNQCCPTPRPAVFRRSRYCSDNRYDNPSYNRVNNHEKNHETNYENNRPTNREKNHETNRENNCVNNHENNRENNIVNNEPKISTFNDNKKESVIFRRNNISPENPFEFEIIDDLPSNTS